LVLFEGQKIHTSKMNVPRLPSLVVRDIKYVVTKLVLVALLAITIITCAVVESLSRWADILDHVVLIFWGRFFLHISYNEHSRHVTCKCIFKYSINYRDGPCSSLNELTESSSSVK
jgi:hypothetical protein